MAYNDWLFPPEEGEVPGNVSDLSRVPRLTGAQRPAGPRVGSGAALSVPSTPGGWAAESVTSPQRLIPSSAGAAEGDTAIPSRSLSALIEKESEKARSSPQVKARAKGTLDDDEDDDNNDNDNDDNDHDYYDSDDSDEKDLAAAKEELAHGKPVVAKPLPAQGAPKSALAEKPATVADKPSSSDRPSRPPSFVGTRPTPPSAASKPNRSSNSSMPGDSSGRPTSTASVDSAGPPPAVPMRTKSKATKPAALWPPNSPVCVDKEKR